MRRSAVRARLRAGKPRLGIRTPEAANPAPRKAVPEFPGEALYRNDRYGNTYVVDRPGLTSCRSTNVLSRSISTRGCTP
ncbi:hypothetical protein ACWEFL_21580 [Streptomyces sp. NPDC004838]